MSQPFTANEKLILKTLIKVIERENSRLQEESRLLDEYIYKINITRQTHAIMRTSLICLIKEILDGDISEQ